MLSFRLSVLVPQTPGSQPSLSESWKSWENFGLQ